MPDRQPAHRVMQSLSAAWLAWRTDLHYRYARPAGFVAQMTQMAALLLLVEGTAALVVVHLTADLSTSSRTLIDALTVAITALTCVAAVEWAEDGERCRFFADIMPGFRVAMHRWLRAMLWAVQLTLPIALVALLQGFVAPLLWFWSAVGIVIPLAFVCWRAVPLWDAIIVAVAAVPVAAAALVHVPIVGVCIGVALNICLPIQLCAGVDRLRYQGGNFGRKRSLTHGHTSQRRQGTHGSPAHAATRHGLSNSHTSAPRMPVLRAMLPRSTDVATQYALVLAIALAAAVYLQRRWWFTGCLAGLVVSLEAIDQLVLNIVAGQYLELASLKNEGVAVSALLRRQLTRLAVVAILVPALLTCLATLPSANVSWSVRLAACGIQACAYAVGFCMAVVVSVRYRGRPHSRWYNLPMHTVLLFEGAYMVVDIYAVFKANGTIAVLLLILALAAALTVASIVGMALCLKGYTATKGTL